MAKYWELLKPNAKAVSVTEFLLSLSRTQAASIFLRKIYSRGPRETKTAIQSCLPSCMAFICFRNTGPWVVANSFTELQKPGFAKT